MGHAVTLGATRHPGVAAIQKNNAPGCAACAGKSMLGRVMVHAGAPNKIETTMREFKGGTLHSGSKTGPKVTTRQQAVAIALSQQRKANAG